MTPNCSYTVTLELGFFASRIGRSEMQCAALGFPYAVNLEMDDSLKWVLFNVKKKAISLITTPSLSINNSIKLRVPRNGVVSGEVQFAKKARFFCFFVFDLDFSKALSNLIVYYPTVKA